MRLIDADLAKVMFMHRARLVHYGFMDRLCVPYDAVDEVPTVGDAVLVVHGRWDDIPNTYMSVAGKDGSYHGNATSCSVCHEVNPNAYKTNYCPNCGAKMDVEENNGVD